MIFGSQKGFEICKILQKYNIFADLQEMQVIPNLFQLVQSPLRSLEVSVFFQIFARVVHRYLLQQVNWHLISVLSPESPMSNGVELSISDLCLMSGDASLVFGVYWNSSRHMLSYDVYMHAVDSSLLLRTSSIFD